MTESRSNPFVLREHEVWQGEFFDKAAGSVLSSLRRVTEEVEREIKRARTEEGLFRYEDDQRSDYTPIDWSANLTSIITQGFGNIDLRQLNHYAGDLTVTVKTRMALEAELNEEQLERLKGLTDEKNRVNEAREEERLEHREMLCQASVHEGGRGVGFRQCQRKGRHLLEDQDQVWRRCCSQHKKEFEKYGRITWVRERKP